jgi:hypothetical protein
MKTYSLITRSYSATLSDNVAGMHVFPIFRVLLQLAILFLLACSAQATVINFDSIDTSQGRVTGDAVIDYLSTFGITVTGQSPTYKSLWVMPDSESGHPYLASSGTNKVLTN